MSYLKHFVTNDKLPAVTSDQGVLFAKLKYEGNKIIGHNRAYADMFAIVDDAVYGNVKGEEKSVGVLRYDKNPKNELNNYKGADRTQLVEIK